MSLKRSLHNDINLSHKRLILILKLSKKINCKQKKITYLQLWSLRKRYPIMFKPQNKKRLKMRSKMNLPSYSVPLKVEALELGIGNEEEKRMSIERK